MGDEEKAEDMCADLLPFQRRIIQDMIEEDGLCIMAAGLGWQRILAVMLQLQIERRRNPKERGVVLLLGCTDWQRTMIKRELHRLDPALHRARKVAVAPDALPLPADANTPADARLYRSSNRKGYLRAFSDQPTSFSHGFAKVEKVMRALYIKSVYLWPRFEAHVKDCLKASEEGLQLEVIELALQMTPAMTAIYDAIADIMDSCIKELRRSNKIDTTELSLDHGLFKSFDEHVRRQLEAVWHTVSPRTKQVVADLKTLRELAEYLLHFDAVTFLTYLETLRAGEGISSFWLFHDAAHLILDEAKRRVYEVMNSKKASEAAGSKRKAQEATSGFAIEPVLEELPKWRMVCKIVQELQSEGMLTEPNNGHVKDEPVDLTHGDLNAIDLPGLPPPSGATPSSKPPSAPVLIVAQEARTITQLRDCLAKGGPEGLLRRLYEEYVLRRAAGKGKGKGDLPRWGSSGRAGGRGRAARGSGSRSKASDAHGTGRPSAQEDEAMLQEAKQLLQPNGSDQHQMAAKAAKKGSQGGPSSRGRGRGRKASASRAESPERVQAATGPADREASEEEALTHFVRFYNLESKEEGVLWDVKPSYIIMYDPDMAFIRQIEVFKAEQPLRPLRVYHLHYEDSQESDKFTAAVSREVTIFQDLIRQKEFMVLPDPIQALDQAKKAGASLMHPDALAALPGVGQNAITRRAGGRLSNKPQPTCIVIDVREFMGSLPAVLHQQGLQVVPVTLEVGDYILSPDVCVERKSLSDLRQSFISGRLYNQAEAMSKYYKVPTLLIEFDGDKEFVLHGPSDITEDIKADSLISKLVLLTLHFPRLRVIWSRSLHSTADIFRSLKTNQEDPDALVAATTGIPVGPDGMPDTGAEAVVNQSAVDVLRRLPGVSDANYRGLMHAAPSLAQLAALSLTQLEAAMEGRQAAKKLHDWLHAPVPHLAA
ncbi:hypothetical protein WJX84_003319 [Apatococcus fuscideae]|uniref:ERCC4 domain-containing protein n=1 Tax=Apatococcus fuscideae TaxID=2026836 RepID=A0AAW1STE6_9CHLO